MCMMNTIIDPYFYFITWSNEELKDYFRSWEVKDLEEFKGDLEARCLYEYCAIIRDILIEKT